jgi:integrase
MTRTYPAQATLSPLETELLLDRLDKKSRRVAPVAHLMLELGLRIGEARLARWDWIDDINAQAATLTVPDYATKTKTPRTLPITTTLRLYLLEIRNRQNYSELATWPPTWPLVLNRWGKPPSRVYCSRVIATAAEAALHRRIRTHLLRKTFATQLLKHTNLRVVQLALGHRSIKSTEIYTHPGLNELRDALEKRDIELLRRAPQ